MLAVFIGGCARSGTTLLGSMLGAHSECLCTPESQFKTDVFLRMRNSEKTIADIEYGLYLIKNHWRFKIWGLPLNLCLKEKIHSYQDLIKFVVRVYGEKVGKPTPKIWIDHTPTNMKYSATLLNIFPDAKFIHIVRDGRAVASSLIPLDWGPNTIDKAAYFWLKRVQYGIQAEESIKNGQIVRISFEELVENPKETLEGLCSFLNITFQSQMVKGAGFNVPSYTVKQHSLIGNPPDKNRINIWEKKLTPRQVEIFESIAGDLLLKLGYSLHYGLKARKITTTEKLFLNLQEFLKRRLINKIRKKYRKHKAIFSERHLLTSRKFN